MESAQKRERDRKNRQKRQDKDDRRKERARQKVERLTHPGAAGGSATDFPAAADFPMGPERVSPPARGQG